MNQIGNEVHHHHDASYKFLLSSKKLFVEFLRSFVKRSWTEEITEEHVEPIPHSFVLQDFKQQEADVVYQVNIRGQKVLFYVLVELQSTVDYRMSYRLLLYQTEIWRYWLNNQAEGMNNRRGFSLPPIVPIVLYNGKRKWSAASSFRQLLLNEQMFGSELMDFQYILIDVARYTEDQINGIVEYA